MLCVRMSSEHKAVALFGRPMVVVASLCCRTVTLVVSDVAVPARLPAALQASDEDGTVSSSASSSSSLESLLSH